MAKKKKTSYEEWLKQNDSDVVRIADVAITGARGVRDSIQNFALQSRISKYNTPGFNPYESYSTAVQYGKDLQSMYDSYKGQNYFASGQPTGANLLNAFWQEIRLKSAITRHNTYMDGIADEAAFNEQIAYPMRYQGLTSAAGVNARLKGMQQTISGLRQSGQTEKANALQAEYDWLSQRQYDYWRPEDFDAKVKELTGLADQARANSRTHGNYTQTSTGLQRQTSTRLMNELPNSAELREQGDLDTERQLRGQVSMLQAAKERNAYRDVMKDWSEQDFKDMEELASLTDARSGARKASRAGAGRRSRGTHSMINGYNERISELEKKFLDKGYSEEEVDAIVAYFIRDSHAMQRQKDLQELQDWGSQNFWTGLTASVASVPLSLAGGYGYVDIALQNATAKTDPFTGDRQRIDQYSAGTIFSDASSAIRSAVGEKINSPVGNLVYQAAMSFADSFVAMQSGEWVGEAMLGLSAATQATRDAYARGATDTQALIMGGMAGLAESLFEHVSIDKLRIMRTSSAASRKTIREFALDWVKQSFTEASEEGATDIANLISDAIIMGDKSELNTMIKQYQASGMSESDATVQAWKDWGSQLFQDMAAGFLSGGMGTVVNTGIGTFQRNAGYLSEGRKILNAGNASTLKELGTSLPEGSYGRGLAESVNADGTNRKTARQLGAIASELNQNTLRQGVQSRLEQLGVANASETATAIMRELNGQTTTKAQDQLLKSKAAQRVLTEFRSAAEGSTNYTNEWAYNALYENAERGRNLRTNDEAVKEVAEFAKDYGRHEEAVNKLFKLQSDMPVESFKTGFDAAYTMGKNGVDMEQAMTATATQRMSETQRALAWEIGRSAANNTTTEEGVNVNGEEGSVSVPGGGERYDGARAEESVGKLAEGAEPSKGNGQVLSRSAKDSGAADLKYEVNPVSTADFGIAGGTQNKSIYRVSENQKLTPAVQAAVDTAKANGRNIVLFGGGNLEVRDGDAIASVRGLYDPNTDTMYVRVDHSRYTAEQIAKHENGHGLIAEGRITVKEVQERMLEEMDEDAVKDALADYADAYEGINISDEELWEEIVCDALGGMNIFEGITGFADYAERAEQRGEAIRNAAAEMQKGRAPPAEADNTQKLSRETDREIVQTLGAGARVDANKDGQLIFAQSKDKHTVAFSIETLNNGGRRKLQKALEENGHTTEEIRDVLQHIEDTVTFIADLGVEYEGKGYENLRQNLYADIITDVRTHKQVLSTLVRNGDYPVNLDLALVCKKRVAYMRMISRLVQDGVLEKVTFGGDAIAKVNDILRKNGFETACLGCFVEARRLQIQNWAESIVNEWNRQVDKRVKNAPDFGFAAGKTANLSADELDAIEDEYKGAKLNEKGNKKLKQASVENKMGQLLDTTPSLLKHLRVEDLLTPAGISALRRRDGTLFSLVQQRYGAASPKIVQDFNPYNGEIADLSFKFIKDRNGEGIGGSKKYIDAAVRQLGGRPTKNKGESNAEFAKRKADFDRQAENMAMRKYLYDIGGARMQSFSDFMIENVFDYVQMFADLAAKRLPMHGYSKEIMALRLFGMTGAKWNGSLIAHAERSMGKELAGLLPAKEAANGRGIVVTDPMTGKQYAICFDDYHRHKATGSFIQSIGMKDIFALQLDPRYSSNVGSITIGVSDAQIRAMLNHPLFSMVIPYHKSGMIKEYAIRVGVDMYNDYTEYQNTRIGKVYDRNGNEVEELRVKDKVVHADTHYDFNEAVQRLGDAKAAADEYIAWCAEKHPVYSGKKVIGYETFLPKFSDSPEGYNFAYDPDTGEMRENYYKLLEDFTSYDSITGESAVQGDVRMVFPEKDGLSTQEIEEYKQRLRDTGIYTEEEINRYAQRAQMSFQDLVREAVEERLQYKKATEPNWEATVQEVEKTLLSDKSARSTPEERQKKRDAKKGNEQSFSRDLSALDSDYMTAVENGDVETAQRMVDEAARQAGYTVKGWHGTGNKPFSKFNYGRSGIYITTDEDVAKTYGDNVMPLYGTENNQLVIDADGHTHFDIPISEWLRTEIDKYPLMRGKSDTDTLAKVARNLGYSSLRINNIDDSESLASGVHKLADDVVYFESLDNINFKNSQVKSADPVTYDDSGNIIPLSERFNPENADIRFSRDLENLDELRRENDRLRKRLDAAKQQTKRTTEPTLREGDVRKAARGLLKEMDSTLTVDDVADDMKALGEYMMRGESKRERAPSWEEVKRRASEIAERIVDNASALSEASDVELYKELRNYLRTTKLTLAETDRADMQDGYAEFVKRNFNRIKLGNEGLPVDSAYQEMQEMYGKGLFPDDITHPADQLMHIEDVLNGLRPVYENPHSFHRQEAVAWAANAVIDTLLSEDVRQTAPTFADKAEARREKDVAEAVAWERYKGEQREDRLKERYAKRMKDALQKAKERRARDIDRLVLKQKFKESARKERSARTALWNKILDLKKDFRRMVEKPQQADSKHAPLRLARALDGVTSCFSVENRERILPISELDRALGKLRDVYKLAEKDDELALYYDEGLIDNIDAVRTMLNEVDPFDATLDSQKLQKVYDLLKMCKHNVTTANQFVSRNWAKTIIEAGRKWAAEIASASIIFKKGFAAQLLNYQLRPDSMFARFSGFAKNSVGEQIQEMFVDGEEKMLRIQQDFYYAFERFSKSKEFDKLTRHGKASLVDVGLKDENGNAIKLTRDQMLALYMNLRSEDNILALAYGGADIPGVSTYYTGKVAKSFDDSVRTVSIDANVFKLIDEARNLADEAQGENVTDERRQEIQQRLDELQSEVKALEQEAFTNLFGVKAKIEKQLTKFEKDLVEAADEWMLKSKDYINAETKAMYGIEKAQVEHYWPIHRNMNFVNTDMRTAVNEINLENWGSLKERVKSHAPIKLTGFIFELDNHTKKMSQFCGFAAAQRDFNKLYQTRMPYQHSTLKEQIAKKFGSDSGLIGVSGMEYIDNYIAAVSGGGDATKPSVLAWARRNLPRATLSANIRVALSQVASVPTAAAEVGWGAMAKGFARYSLKGFSGKQIEALAKADPWFWQRSRGDGGMREFAEMKESTFALDRGYNKIAGTKVGKALLNWCQKFDMYATYTQWAMAEEWVKQNRKDLKKGSEAFDEAVSRKYRDILRRTQPNYTVTERSDLLRDKRESMKWATMYKTQSNQNLNILYDATAQLRQYTRDFKNGKNGVTQQDVADARRQFARAYSGVILGGTVTFVLFRAFANALLHAMNAYRDDDDKELTLESFLEGLGEETLGAISGMFLFGSEIEEFVFAAVTHGKYWGLSDSAVSAISDVVKNLYNLTQDPSKEQILKFVNSLAAPLGLPISNVKKIVDGIGYHIEDIRNGEFLSFDAGVNRTAQQQASRFAKAMEDGDTAKMKRIYDEMVATSKAKDPEANTQEALRGQIKDAFIGTDGKATLSESEALKLLEKFGGKTGDEAKDILNKWKFEKDFGYEYKELGDRYIAGELSDSEYKNALMNYGGKSEEDADEIVGKNKLVREYGFEYSEDNIVDAAIAGDITTEEAFDIWTNYGGVNEREAENRATRLQFVVDNPGIAYDDAKIGMVTDYDEYVAAAKGANIKPLSAEDFSEYWLAADALSSDYDVNGNPIKGSERKDKVFAYIAGLNIPAEQKTAIALSMYAAKTVSKMKTW